MCNSVHEAKTITWEQCKVGAIASFAKGTGYSKADICKSGTPLILYGRLYTKYETVIHEVDTYAVPRAGSVYSRGGEVIVPASGETAEDISIASVVEKAGILLGGDLNIIIPDEAVDPTFLALTLSHGKAHNELSKLAQGKSVVHIHNTDIQSVEIQFPSMAEQVVLSNLFVRIETLITLHQRKYDQLIRVKKAMLEKMFPKGDARVPEIRFSGFTDAWEQRKLGDIAEIVGGGTPSTSNSSYWDGDIDWYAPAEMEGQRYAVGSARKITIAGLQHSSAKILPAEKTVLFTSRAGIGKMAILKRPGATNQGFQSLILKAGYNPYFIYSMGGEIKAKAEGVASGSTFLEISGKMLGNIEIAIPTETEQDAIAACFEHLDDLITLHQRKSTRLLYTYSKEGNMVVFDVR